MHLEIAASVVVAAERPDMKVKKGRYVGGAPNIYNTSISSISIETIHSMYYTTYCIVYRICIHIYVCHIILQYLMCNMKCVTYIIYIYVYDMEYIKYVICNIV